MKTTRKFQFFTKFFGFLSISFQVNFLNDSWNKLLSDVINFSIVSTNKKNNACHRQIIQPTKVIMVYLDS